jgi:THO complex subunit 4
LSSIPADPIPSIQEYFAGTVGPVKRVLLTYGPNGQSRGVATIIFTQTASAAKAAKELDGVSVDKRPMKVRTQPLDLNRRDLT